MSSRQMKCSSVVLTLLALLLMAGPIAWGAPRNVLLIVGDDHGRDAGCYGHPVIKTPALDRLARRGTLFTHAFATVASCSPSRSVILTGQQNHTNGMYGLAHAAHNFQSMRAVRSVPRLLADAGYRTGLVGKYHLQPKEVYPFEKMMEGSGQRDGMKIARAAEGFMAEVSDRPFFLLVGLVDPHRSGGSFPNDKTYPGVQPVRYRPEDMIVPPFMPDLPEVRHDLAEYAQAVSRMDAAVGLVLEALEKTGHADDTLVIYLSDNGMPFPGAKTTLYDPGIRLPLLISSPDQKKRGVRNEALVSWVDIAPTILEFAGAQSPPEIQGGSLLPILERQDDPSRQTVYGSHTFHEVTMYYPMRMIRTREYKYILNLAHELEFPTAVDLWNSPTWQAILTGNVKQMGERSTRTFLHRPREELYDLRADPNEIRNLADDPARKELLADLRRQLREWQDQTKDPWLIKYEHE